MKKSNKLIWLVILILGTSLLQGCGGENVVTDIQNYTCEVNTPIESEIVTATQTVQSTEPSVLYTQPGETVICMVGDVLMHTPVSDSGVMEDGSIDYSHLFYNTKDIIEEADLAIVNQEVILGGEELRITGYPTFNARVELGDALADSGFDVVCHATNHCLDRGFDGIDKTVDFWRENHPEMQVVGIYDNVEDANTICVKEIDGIKIAILNYTYGTNGIALPSDKEFCVSLLNRDRIARDVEWAKQNTDFIIVCPHWGTEYRHEPDSYQKELAAYFDELDVDLVLGTHPHVIEPYGYVGDTLVYYSLGNYVNATSGVGDKVADRMLGEIARITIAEEDGEVVIKDYEAIPIVSHLDTSKPGKITVYKLDDYSSEQSLANEIIKQDPSFSLEYLTDLWQSCNNMQ